MNRLGVGVGESGAAQGIVRRRFALLWTLVLAACGAGTQAPGDPVHSAGPASATYADVAPLLGQSCLGCHRDAAPGRPPMGTFEEVRSIAPALLAAVLAGRMPPGGLDESGACGSFEGPAPLTTDEIATLASFIEGGALRGTPVPAVAPVPAASDVPAAAARVVTRTFPLQRGDADVHRCYLIDARAQLAGAYLTGVRVGGEASLHHAMIFTLPTASLDAARAREGEGGAAGWSCRATPEIDGAMLAFAWVPGRDTVTFPASTGVPLGDGLVVVQIHQHGAAARPGVAVSLLVDDSAQHPLRVLPIAATGFSLPAGQREAHVRSTVAFPSGDARVFGVMPHLHQAGRSVSLRTADARCLVSAPRYNFDFQRVAFYREPLALAGSTPLQLECVYNTLNRVGPTVFGETSDDEMCTVFLFVSDR